MVPIWKGLIRMTITACKKGQKCFEWFIPTCKICWGQCIREHPWESPDQRIDSHFEIFVVKMEVKEETNTSILILNWMAWESLDGKHGKNFYFQWRRGWVGQTCEVYHAEDEAKGLVPLSHPGQAPPSVLFSHLQGKSKRRCPKNGYFTVGLTVRGGGRVSHNSLDRKQMWKYWPIFSIEF